MKILISGPAHDARLSKPHLRRIATAVWQTLSPRLTPAQRAKADWPRFRICVHDVQSAYEFACTVWYRLRRAAGLIPAVLPEEAHFPGDIERRSVTAPKQRSAPSPTVKTEKRIAGLRKKLRLAETRVTRLRTLLTKAERQDARLKKRLSAEDSTKLGDAAFAERMRLRRQQQAQP